MANTLETVRRAVGYELGECFVGRVDSAGSTYIYDSDLIDPDEDYALYDRAWLRLYAADGALSETRRVRLTNESESIQGYDPEEGRLYFLPALEAVPEKGDYFETHSLLAPDDLDRLIDKAMDRCYYIDYVPITLVANQREYDLSIYDWITTPDQVTDVFWVIGNTTGEYQYSPVEWFELSDDAGAITLHIRPISSLATIATIRLMVLRPYGSHVWTDSGTDCPLDWLTACTLYEVYTFLSRGAPGEDAKFHRAQAKQAAEVMRMKMRQYQPRPTRRVQLHNHRISSWDVRS